MRGQQLTMFPADEVKRKEKPLNIYQKLIEVRKSVPYLKKENEGKQFNYVSSSQIIGAVRQKLDEYSLFLEVKVLSKEIVPFTEEIIDNKGNQKTRTTYQVDLDLEYTWVDAENPKEKVVCPWVASGIDIGDSAKALGKALTYAEKYFLLKQFNIATDSDDPDQFQQKVENNVVEFPNEQEKNEFQSLIEEVAELHSNTEKWVLEQLKVKNPEKLNKQQLKMQVGILKGEIEQYKGSEKEQVTDESRAVFMNLVQEFAKLRDKTNEDVIEALGINAPVENLSDKQLEKYVLTLQAWIQKAQMKEVQEAK